jgi:hypothetical protein
MDRPCIDHGGPPEPRAERALAEAEDVLTALRDELAAVSTSPEFADRVRRRLDAELPLLREELAAVAPSPQFKARVRQQIEAQPQTSGASWLSGWRWVVPAGAAAAGIALAVVMLGRGTAGTPAPVATTVTNAPQDVPTPAQLPEEPRTSKTPSASSQRASNVNVRKDQREPSLEVITDQPAILRALFGRIRGDVQAGEGPALASDTAPEIKVIPVDVSPVVVKPLVDPAEGGSSPIIRKN